MRNNSTTLLLCFVLIIVVVASCSNPGPSDSDTEDGDTGVTGIVTTFAGPPEGDQTEGCVDGIGTDARFQRPYGITSDGTYLYVVDYWNHKIRRIEIATREVTILVGPAGSDISSGDTDATGNDARFYFPAGITTDGTNLYVVDNGNNKIRKVVIATGVVTTIAGPAQGTTTSGDADETGNAARFNGPRGITINGNYLYVADDFNHKIRRIDITTGAVTTFVGPAEGDTTSGDADGTGNSARFNRPSDITTDGTHLFVADTLNNKVRQIVIATGVVTTLAGPAEGTTTTGDTDGTGNDARFYFPYGITTDGNNLFVADYGNNKIRKVVILSREVTTLAGPSAGDTTSGDADGTGNDARFDQPIGVIEVHNDLYVTDYVNHKIRKIE